MNITLKHNLSLSNIDAPLYDLITKELSFQNPKWIENLKMGRWNRGTPKELKFYRKAKQGGLYIPRGYLRQLILTCRNMSIDYQIIDKRRELEPVSFKFEGRLKEFQQKAAKTMLSKEFGTLSAPTGSGKTVMALYIAAMRQQPSLVVVHTGELANQWIDKIEQFLCIDRKEIGLIGLGKKKIGEKITVSLVQSLYKYSDKLSKEIGFLIADECHRCPSRTFTEAVSAFDSKYMMGLTATPWRRDNLSKLIFWYLGDIHHQIDKEGLIQRGDILSLEVIDRQTDFKPYYDPVNDYSKMLSELTADDQRNRMIAEDVAKEVKKTKGTLLVLSDRKKHCETLGSILKYSHKISCQILTGDMDTALRKKVIERLNNKEIDVLIATGQLIGEGFDCPHLSTLFLTTPVKFSGRVIQYLGRVLRPYEGKKVGRVYDYVDVNVNVLANASKARHKVYDTIGRQCLIK